MILAAVFFVSGADAAIVLGTFSSHGDLDPKKWLTVAWGYSSGWSR